MQELNQEADKLVLQNRLRETYNNINMSGPKEIRRGRTRGKRRKHGCLSANLEIDKQALLNEAKTWETGQSIN